MIDTILLIAGGLIILILMAMLYGCATQKKHNADKWQKWEQEYWLLRNSDAIKEDYEIGISWLPLGENNCIRKKQTENQNEKHKIK